MQSILIVHQGAIGDFILSLPALEAIHLFHPKAGFNFIGHPEIVAVIRNRPYFKSVRDCNSGNWAPLYNSGPRPAATHGDLLPPADAAYVFGRSSSQILADNLALSLGKPVYRLDTFPQAHLQLSVAAYQCAQLQELGLPAMPPPPAIISPSPQDSSQASDFLNHKLEPGDRLVLLHPGSGGRKKLWGPTGWLSVIAELSACAQLRFAILQGPADLQIVQYLCSRLASNSFSQIVNWPLGKLAALMSNAALFIGNDSGITHLAAACGTPTIALFGPTDPRVWGPRGPKVRIVHYHCRTQAKRWLESEKITARPKEIKTVVNQARRWLEI